MSSSVISAKGLSALPVFSISAALTRQVLENDRQFVTCFFDAQPDQAERAAMVEDDHQDNALGNDGNVDVVLFPLVEKDGELFFADQLGEAAGGGDVAGRQ